MSAPSPAETRGGGAEGRHRHTRDGTVVHRHLWDHMPAEGLVGRFNKRLALVSVTIVGSMWCAYFFAVLAALGLPTALKPGNIGLLFWFSSDFLQLTLLSVIIVGQNLQGRASDVRSTKMFEDAEVLVEQVEAMRTELESLRKAADDDNRGSA